MGNAWGGAKEVGGSLITGEKQVKCKRREVGSIDSARPGEWKAWRLGLGHAEKRKKHHHHGKDAEHRKKLMLKRVSKHCRILEKKRESAMALGGSHSLRLRRRAP